jgi:hypothetical protein
MIHDLSVSQGMELSFSSKIIYEGLIKRVMDLSQEINPNIYHIK